MPSISDQAAAPRDDGLAQENTVAAIEQTAREGVGLLISNHSLAWDGSEWFDKPEGGREGYAESE